MTKRSDDYALTSLKKQLVFVSPKCYKINGKEYYRVTSILGVIEKHALKNWAAKKGYKASQKILKTRQAIGTTVHSLVEHTLKGDLIDLGGYEKEIQDGLTEFDNFRIEAKLKPKLLEQPLWSNKYYYAGTPDYIGQYTSPINYLVSTIINHKRVKVPKFEKGALVIGDWKTGKDIYQEYWLQIAAYIFALKELTGIQVDGAFIARIRDGKIQVKEKTYDELEKEFPAFLHALGLYEWKYHLGKFAFLRKRK